MMNKAVIYIHGQGGNAKEADHYKALFKGCDVVGLDYAAQTPWEAKEEFPVLLEPICKEHRSVQMVANSIGAYFAMQALADWPIEQAWFISPCGEHGKAHHQYDGLGRCHGEETPGERGKSHRLWPDPFLEYLCYAREHSVRWDIPTHILYGEKDTLTSYPTISAFAEQIHADLTVMKDGEHWFHTPEQMQFLDDWVRRVFGLICLLAMFCVNSWTKGQPFTGCPFWLYPSGSAAIGIFRLDWQPGKLGIPGLDQDRAS